ncbi:phosphatidate cytidylyltransferase [Marinimicrobium sp. ABcell2]|uniref:phosphatidate cytidylyltransferase n=1 Tax=Marinimicrobium sp. ABcell2 TaxID=3069751 RepID=UPI0027B75F51|nr:phosphatidate cytidylyltransferase [Marinimicrobium sp. ABcell2]MDQ2075329.1 phosphatidate cytidylyltransferase [Marinimicrobium sp. ABcell2]
MLKQRVITAVVLIAVFLAVLVYLPVPWFAAFVAGVVLVGAWEWANLAGLESAWQRRLYAAAVGVVLIATAFYLALPTLEGPPTLEQNAGFRNLLVVGCTWWAVALLWVQGYPQSALLWQSRWVRALMGLLVLVPAWAGLVYVRALDQGAWLVLLMVVCVASADIGAYFAGRRWGRHKLAPAVSPGKTWEGFAGGLALNLVLVLLVGWLWGGLSYGLALAIIVPTALVSVLGDLQESMLKRHRGVKDSSALLPGHGGVLDRVDSLTAAAPVFALALLAIGWAPA